MADSDEQPIAPGPAQTLLREVGVHLEHLVNGGEPAAIDLQALPVLTAEEHARLRQLLGTGEVVATVEAMGPTEVAETAYPGVWWVTDYGADGDVLSEQIEIAWVPDRLPAQAPDAAAGLDRLRGLLQDPAVAES
jgi:hydrogenase-1 operon protein HyaF